MNKRLRSTLILFALLFFVISTSFIYYKLYLGEELIAKKKQLEKLNEKIIDETELNDKLLKLQSNVMEIDSLLMKKPFFVYSDINPISFFQFTNRLVSNFSSESQVNVEFIEQRKEGKYITYNYRLTGFGLFEEIFTLFRNIEHSKSLKKINSFTFGNAVRVNKNEVPVYYVNFDVEVKSYVSTDKSFAPSEVIAGEIKFPSIYNFLYPLIRTEIPPNIYNLLDVQDAKLLALLPDGAFIADNRGNTYLLSEGEEVYLGYLTKIDYKNNMVSFVLNKGGIIERLNLFLETTNSKKE